MTERMVHHVRSESARNGSHGFDHVIRVFFLCKLIGSREDAYMQVLLPAALFHDIAREQEEKGGIRHEELGARMAEDYLRMIAYDPESIPKILHAIRTHRYQSAEKAETPESRILSDADKLDAMGAVGIARTFLRAGEHKGGIADGMHHMTAKLLNLKGMMYTETGKQLAEKRHRILEEFLEALRLEVTPPEISPDIPL